MMLRLKIELVDVWICHKADLPFAHGDVRLIALKRSWFIAQKLARFQRVALPLVGASSHTIRLTIVGQDTVADVWGSPGGAAHYLLLVTKIPTSQSFGSEKRTAWFQMKKLV